MLTKRDLELIKEIVDNSIDTRVPLLIKAAFDDFYDNIFEPHVTKSEQHQLRCESNHREIVRAIRGLQNETEEIKEYIKDHDERIERLENQPSVKN